MPSLDPASVGVGQDVLAANAHALGLELSGRQLAAFSTYERELLDWNARVNLTSIDDPTDVQIKHFADSLAVLGVLPPGGLRLLDVGAGAGFPGVPIKLVRPEIDLTLLDATGKKTVFLSHLVGTLGLERVQVLTGRAEELGQRPDEREAYDVVVARAVASLRVLAELCLPLARIGGMAIAQKKAGVDDELHEAGRAISILGGRLRPIVRYRLPGLADERWLVVIEKARPTPRPYPRRPGLPAKSPL